MACGSCGGKATNNKRREMIKNLFKLISMFVFLCTMLPFIITGFMAGIVFIGLVAGFQAATEITEYITGDE